MRKGHGAFDPNWTAGDKSMIVGVQMVLSHVQLFSFFSIRLTVYPFLPCANSTCLGLIFLELDCVELYGTHPQVKVL